MDIESMYHQKKNKHTVIVRARFTALLNTNEIQVDLDRNLDNVEAMRVKHFGIADDGSISPIESFGILLVLFSNLGSNVTNTSFRISSSLNAPNVNRSVQFSNAIAWNTVGRNSNSASPFPYGIPMPKQKKLWFSSPKPINSFTLGINTPAFDIPTHLTPYVMEVVIDFYTCS